MATYEARTEAELRAAVVSALGSLQDDFIEILAAVSLTNALSLDSGASSGQITLDGEGLSGSRLEKIGSGTLHVLNVAANPTAYGVLQSTGGIAIGDDAHVGAAIVGSNTGIVGISGNVSVSNKGIVASGVYSGGSLTTGGDAGINAPSASIYNSGLIAGGNDSIRTQSGLVLTNTGTIDGLVNNNGGSASVLNAGSITSRSLDTAFKSVGGGTFTNAAAGAVTGGGGALYGNAVQFLASGTVNNYGTLTSPGSAPAILGFNDRAYAVNLYSGSTTGSIRLTGGDDLVSLYTGRNNISAVRSSYIDPVSGVVGYINLQSTGVLSAASFGAIALGSGTNTVALRGQGTAHWPMAPWVSSIHLKSRV
jgi:hypothetical protein